MCLVNADTKPTQVFCGQIVQLGDGEGCGAANPPYPQCNKSHSSDIFELAATTTKQKTNKAQAQLATATAAGLQAQAQLHRD